VKECRKFSIFISRIFSGDFMTDKEFNRRMAAFDKRLEKSRAEFDRRSAEFDRRSAEFDRRSAEFDRKIDKIGIKTGNIDENIGNHAEQFFQNIFEKKREFGGIKYDDMIPNIKHCDKSGEIEFDIFLENGNSVAIIEVKSRIHPNFVKEFAEERLKKFRKYFPQYSKYKTYLGIAGFSFSKKVLEEAEKYGIGIVRQAGKSVEMNSSKLKAD
jgi:hypothetical protein